MFKYLILLFSSVSLFAADRPDISPDDIDMFGDLCPLDSALEGHSGKFGHTVVLVDTTTTLSEAQFALLDRLIFDESVLMKMPPYDRLSILNLTGIDIQASQNEYTFSMCRPRNGQKGSKHKLDQGTFWVPAKKLERNWNIFLDELNKAKQNLAMQPTGKYTQLYEQLKELSRIPDLMFDDSYETRKLIIVSDFLQHSEYLDLYASCVDKKKCTSWSKIKNDKSLKLWIESNLPNFGDDLPEVEFVYLNANSDSKLNIGLMDFWDDYFAEVGIQGIRKEVETSTR